MIINPRGIKKLNDRYVIGRILFDNNNQNPIPLMIRKESCLAKNETAKVSPQ